MLKNVEADTPKRELSVDSPRDGIEAYRSVVNVVNAVNGTEEALLSTTPPDKDKPKRATSAEATREDRPQWRAA